MTARYLLTITDEDAVRLERWLGGRLSLAPLAVGRSVTVAGLDAITDEEYEFIGRWLSSSGPLYHAPPKAPHGYRTGAGYGWNADGSLPPNIGATPVREDEYEGTA